MAPKAKDCCEAEFPVAMLGRHFYTVQGWIDRFDTWRFDLQKRIAAGKELSVELLIGAELVELAAKRAGGEDALRLRQWAESGAPGGGFWKQGGSRQGNMGGVEASPLPVHRRPWPFSITARSLGLVVFRAGPA
jgi:hypothetical protein